jgi:hypothetical protein
MVFSSAILIIPTSLANAPTAFRAKTAILIPGLNRYYLAVTQHERESAAVHVYSVLP